jgi:hypothetical protein
MDKDETPAEAVLGQYSQSLPASLMRAREAVMARIRPVLRAHGVTELQWRVLRTLAAVGEVEVSADLRRGLVSITPAGRALIAEAAADAAGANADIAQLYGPERMARLLSLLGELEQALSRE